MNTPCVFDEYADTYSAEVDRAIAFARQGHAFFIEAKVNALLEIVGQRIGDVADVNGLDVGCGQGDAHDQLACRIAKLDGVDVSRASLRMAADRHPGVGYHMYDGATLPFADASFDFVFATCVLHHVPLGKRTSLVSEMRRVTRPGGVVAIAEHNPVNPFTRLVVRRCAFDAGVTLVRRSAAIAAFRSAGLKVTDSRYILFFPWRGNVLRRIERIAAPLPIGAQYILAGTGV